MSETTTRTEALAEAMDEAFTYEDDDNAKPTLRFVDDHQTFWRPFAAKVAALLAALNRADEGASPMTTETTTRTETLRRLADEVEAEWAGRIGAHNLVVRVPVPEIRALLDVVEAARDYSPRHDHDWRCEYRTAEKGWREGEPPVIECECGYDRLQEALAALDTPGGQE